MVFVGWDDIVSTKFSSRDIRGYCTAANGTGIVYSSQEESITLST